MVRLTPTDAALLKRIEGYCFVREISETAFGRETINDPNLVTQMRNGRSLTTRTLTKIETCLANGGS